MNKWIVMLTAVVLGAGSAQALESTVYGLNSPPTDGQWNTATNWWHLPTANSEAFFRGDNYAAGTYSVDIAGTGAIAGALYFQDANPGVSYNIMSSDGSSLMIDATVAGVTGSMIDMRTETITADQIISVDLVLTSNSSANDEHIRTRGSAGGLILSGNVSQGAASQGIGTLLGNGDVEFAGSVDGSGKLWKVRSDGRGGIVKITGTTSGSGLLQIDTGATVLLNRSLADSSAMDFSLLRLVGGELALGNDEQIGDALEVGFSAAFAGVFNLDGHTETIGGFMFDGTTQAGSLDMGLDGVLRLTAQNDAAVWGDLTVLNWTEGSDHIYVDGGSFSSSQLANITFDGYAAGAEVIGGELVAIKGVTYGVWAAKKGLAAGVNDDRTDDPDLDGMENLLEYALGGDPLVDDAASILPTADFTVDTIEYIYNRRTDHALRGLDYGLAVTIDDLQLGAWTNYGTAFETGVGAIDSEFDSVTNTLPITGVDMGFLNLEVTENAMFTLYQLPAHGPGMSYVMISEGGKMIVVDGGSGGYKPSVLTDGPYLKSFLEAHGGHVDAWFITHPHDDHIDALIWILQNPGGVQIDEIHGNFPPLDWAGLDDWSRNSITNFNSTGRELIVTQIGDTFDYDEIHIEILSGLNPEFIVNGANDSSIAMRVTDSTKSILFLGDLGPEGGDKLLANVDPSKLKADYVQMAHHGNTGVNENVYQAIHPKYGLWPTPIWLWTNNDGTGPYTTLETRQWMEDLNVLRNYVSGYGVSEIR